MDAPSVTTLSPDALCSRPEAKPAGHLGDKGDPRCRLVDRPSLCHLQDEDLLIVMQETSSQATTSVELAQRLANLPFAAAAADKNASVESRWCQLRNTVQSTALAVLACACRQHQTYVNRPTNDNKAAFYHSRILVQQRLREMQKAWVAREAEEVQGYANHKEWKNFSPIEAAYRPAAKGTASLLSAGIITILTEETLILQRWTRQFRGVLGRPLITSDAAIARLSQVETKADLNLPLSLSPRNYQGRAGALRRKDTRTERNPY
ncbi:hypothetical protein SprV_0702368800 [Sparganum proliferum]